MTVNADKHLDLDKRGKLTMAAQLMQFIKQNPMYKNDLIDGPTFSLFTGNKDGLIKTAPKFAIIIFQRVLYRLNIFDEPARDKMLVPIFLQQFI